MLEDDPNDRALLSHVHPPGWRNPEPAGRYDLVVVGAGTAGLVSAAGAAGLGARVALIEREHLGGDCLNVGCVPSKALLRSAHLAADLRDAERFGLRLAGAVDVDFAAVMRRMREVRLRISPNDSVDRFSRELGVDVHLGEACFVGRDRVEVAGQELRFKKAVIATGARPFVPDVPGLEEAGYLTNESVFDLTHLPRRLVVLGGGPIGCELAQAFRRFGSQVVLVEMASQLLPREDPDAARILLGAFRRDGIEVRLETRLVAVEPGTRTSHAVVSHGERQPERIEFDEMLVAVGRAPNVDGLGLERAGVAFDHRRGVEVDDRLRTSNRRIYAAGDVCMRHRFTHAADFAARIVVQNALFFGRKRVSKLRIPWCTYTDPEIAHIGLYEHEARQRGPELDSFVRELSHVDRAIAEGRDEGFVKIHVRRGSDEILGATIVGRDAGDLIGEVSVCMAAGMGLSKLAGVIHPYPTRAEAIRQLGDAYNRTRLTPRVKRLFEAFLTLRR
jgi:pyruvate/2-oxoglutarate dehydrogenase complex dihydrolipoamide dehydrogenase (E3) component